MAALAEDRPTIEKDGAVVRVPVAASTTIYAGSLVCDNTAGYAVSASATASYKLIGIAQEQVDNSDGDAGDLYVLCHRNMNAWLVNSALGDSGAIAITDRGSACYVADDQSVSTIVAADTLANVYVGVIIDVDATKGVLVELRPGSIGATQVDDLTVTDDLIVGDDAAVGGDLDVTGALTCGDLDPTGDLSLDAGKAVNIAADGVLVVPYEPVASGGAPTQAEMAAGFGAAANGKVGVFADTGGVLYLCAADASLTWHYVAMTVGA